MSAAGLIDELRAVGCEIAVRGGELQLARAMPLPEELLARVRTHKRALLERLSGPPLWDASDWLDHFHERASLLEFTAGLSRRDAEAEALQECFLRFSGRRAGRGPPLATTARTERLAPSTGEDH